MTFTLMSDTHGQLDTYQDYSDALGALRALDPAVYPEFTTYIRRNR